MIHITKLNECFLQISGDYGDMETISEAFSTFAPNYIFHPQYKAGYWDGRLKFFNKADGKFPYGLFGELVEVLKKFDIDCTLSDKLLGDLDNKDKIDDFDEYAYKNLNPKYEPRYYQIDAAKDALLNKRGIFEHATRSGKTLTIFLIINYIYNKYIVNKKPVPYKILFIVPNISLIKQFIGDFKDYGMNMKDVGVYYGKEKTTEPPIIVGTWQSLRKNAELLKKTAFCATDEVHRAKGLEIKGLLEKCVNAKIRLGFTGTMPDETCDKWTIIGNIGPIISQVKTKKLIKEGTLVDIDINILNIEYSSDVKKKLKKYVRDIKKKILDEYKKKVHEVYKGKPAEIQYHLENPIPAINNKIKRLPYESEKKFVQVYSKRKKLAAKLIKKHDGETTLLLFNERKLGKNYLEHLQLIFPDKHILYVDGNISADKREEIRLRAINEKGIIIVASIGTFSTGITIPRLKVIIFLWAGKSKITVLQSIGRTLGTHETKDKSILYDFSDQLKFGKQHGRERLLIYMKAGFNKINTHQINL